MREMRKQKISMYCMKMRLYPSAEQKEKMEKIFQALHAAFNITFDQVFLKNPAVCSEPNENGAVWPNYDKMAKAEWRKFLISKNPIVKCAPSAALETKNGLFLTDARNAWKTRMGNIPVNPEKKKDFHFYGAKKPRRSFFVQIEAKDLIASQDNEKVARITIPKVGRMKARGFNRKLWFGENGKYTYMEALQAGELAKRLSVRVSRDACGDYFISITFHEEGTHSLFLETPVAARKEPVGIDVGVRKLATLSTEEHYDNKEFKKKKQPTLDKLNKKLSRRWGPANLAYRDYNDAIREENRKVSEEAKKDLSQPSRRYLRTQHKKSLVERKIARRRNTYYHQKTAEIVRQYSLIAMETLLVSNMMKNRKLAYKLADAAMSEFLAKIKYKADRHQIPIRCIGIYEPSSQLCSACGKRNPHVKDQKNWTCPNCGTKHDRDINAAKNILQIAIEKDDVRKEEESDTNDRKSTKKKKWSKEEVPILPDQPEIVVAFSRELTGHNDPRYIIKNTETDKIIDDAQGYGYRSRARARRGFKAKLRRVETQN